MDTNAILSMFDGLDEQSKNVLGRTLKKQLIITIMKINEKMASKSQTLDMLSPSPRLIFNAFRACPWDKIKVVIIAQDSFLKPGEATGLCFSVPKGMKIPPSTINIYKCLAQNKFIPDENVDHGDLSSWASQGVLMINAALTTILGTPNEHAAEWMNYTDAIISELSARERSLVFILLGGFAQQKSTLIDDQKHRILTWGHPSPVNTANNKEDNPKHFMHCDVFSLINEVLSAQGDMPIDWNPNAINEINPIPIVAPQIVIDETLYRIQPVNELDPTPLSAPGETLWIFTDGGARANGKANCIASWGIYMTDGITTVRACSLVPPIEIPDKVYKSSNNRGELMAALRALEYAEVNTICNAKIIRLVGDSNITIEGITEKPAAGKANTDLLIPAKESYARLSRRFDITFQRIPMKSHKQCESPEGSLDWFLWKGNVLADAICQEPLPPQKVSKVVVRKKPVKK